MCTFDSPIARCEAMRVMVLTDQTPHQCAVEHGCSDRMKCPLEDYFSGTDIPAAAAKPPDSGWRTTWRIAA